MHPAYSVILFTVSSGAGYGLVAGLGLLGPLGLLPAERALGLAGYGLALGLVSVGLLASTFHLGHPERAWRAFSQWRSSWLSREGVSAVVTYVPSLAAALGWVVFERNDGPWALAGVLAALGALVTLACTAMIYAQLQPIRQWRSRWVLPGYLLLGLASGAAWLSLLVALLHGALAWVPLAAGGLLVLGGLVKLAYWRDIDSGASASTPESATGLGCFGRVRQLDPPHGFDSFVQREMGFRVARKHARRLRRASLWLLTGLPVPALLAAALVPAGPAAVLLAGAAGVSASLGVLVERWLFFAEARHAVTLFYDAREV